MRIIQALEEKKSIEGRISAIKAELATINLPQLNMAIGDARTRHESLQSRIKEQGNVVSDRHRQDAAQLKGTLDSAIENHRKAKAEDDRLRKELAAAVAELENLDLACSESEIKALLEKIAETEQDIEKIKTVVAKQGEAIAAIAALGEEIKALENERDALLAEKVLGADCQKKLAALEASLMEKGKKVETAGRPKAVAEALRRKQEQAEAQLVSQQDAYAAALNGYLVRQAWQIYDIYQKAIETAQAQLTRLYALGKIQEKTGKVEHGNRIVKTYHPVVIPAVFEEGNLFDSGTIDRAQAVAKEEELLAAKGIRI